MIWALHSSVCVWFCGFHWISLMFSLPRQLNLWMTHTRSGTADDITIHLTELLPGAVYTTLYLSSLHTYRNTFQLVQSLTYMTRRAQEHLLAFVKHCKLEKILFIMWRVKAWHMLESKLLPGRKSFSPDLIWNVHADMAVLKSRFIFNLIL